MELGNPSGTDVWFPYPDAEVQFARFGYKGANEWAGTSASKVKLTRKCAFTHTFDIFDCTSDDVKKRLSVSWLAYFLLFRVFDLQSPAAPPHAC